MKTRNHMASYALYERLVNAVGGKEGRAECFREFGGLELPNVVQPQYHTCYTLSSSTHTA